MIYEYDDTFLTDSVNEGELAKKENEAIIEVKKLNVTDDFYKEKLVKARVYMLLAREQLEADGMKDKYNIYEREFNRYINLAKNNSAFTNVGNIPVNRG